MNYEYIPYHILILFFTFLSAFFSGIETAIVSSRRIKVETIAKKGDKNAKRAIAILDRLEDSIGMVLIGNNISNIVATSFITYIATKSFLLNDRELLLITSAQTLIFLFVCEIMPKIVSKANAETLLMSFSIVIIFLIRILYPFIWLSLRFTDRIKGLFKIQPKSFMPVRSREDIATYFLISKNEGLIDEEKQGYLSEILSFKNLQASEIMTPFIDIVAIDVRKGIRELVTIIEKTGFSRIPVYSGRKDNIIGYVSYKYLLKGTAVDKIEDILIKPKFIPSTKNVFELYNEMYKNKTPFMFVVNEYGDVGGLLTFEDIAEEIVGEIQTDDHPDENLITKITDRKYLLSGKLDIDFFQRYFSIPLDKKNYETLAGFMNFLAGKIPEKGDHIKYLDYEFIIEETGLRTVDRATLLMPIQKKKK